MQLVAAVFEVEMPDFSWRRSCRSIPGRNRATRADAAHADERGWQSSWDSAVARLITAATVTRTS